MHRYPGNSVYKTVVVVWLTFSIASVVLAAVTWWELSRKLRIAQEAVAIREDLDGILRLVLDAETAQRGFSLTGDDSFLAPLALAESGLPARFDHLSQLVKEDPSTLTGVMELRGEVEVSLAQQRQVIATRRSEGANSAASLVAKGSDKALMDRIRANVSRLHDRHLVPGSDGGSGARVPLVRAILTSLVAGIMGVGAGVYAFWLARVMLGHQERERRLMEAKLTAERSSREKTFFLANMSHEIRTPMNAILGFSELLASELKEPKQLRYLQALRTSASSLLQLINDILDMSKIEAGIMDLRPEPIDPREICDFVRMVFSESAAKKGVQLGCRIADELPRALVFDRVRLRQVLMNLVGNAVKFTDQGEIEVRVDWEPGPTGSQGTLLLEIQDTGLGIPQDKLEAIFKPFVQAGAHLEQERPGTGLGLAIVQRLTKRMGGTVTAASVMGQGSAFSLRFPDVPVSARLARPENPGSAEAIDFNLLRPSTLLVVDDHEANCELMAGMFAGTHHRLSFARGGAAAVEQARSLRPDLILLDVRMPGMDGRETLSRIRTLPGLELTPVIAVTASNLTGEEEDLKERFSGFVRKPFSKQALFQELAQFLPRATSLPPTQGPSAPASPELLAAVRQLHESEWPALRESLAINECREFAGKLKELARCWPCPPLERYARTLADHAENYAVSELEHHLLDLPDLVTRLEKGSTQ